MEELGNPFLEEGKELLRLDTRDNLDAAVASSICQAEKIGKEKYEAFVTSRLIEGSTPLSEPVKKNKLLLFSWPPPREKSKASLQVSSLKSDVSLFQGSTLLANHEMATLMISSATNPNHVLHPYPTLVS